MVCGKEVVCDEDVSAGGDGYKRKGLYGRERNELTYYRLMP